MFLNSLSFEKKKQKKQNKKRGQLPFRNAKTPFVDHDHDGSVSLHGAVMSTDARNKVYEDELMTWLERHGCQIKDKVAFDQACKLHYYDIMRTLRKDSNPDAVLAYLLDSTEGIQRDVTSPRRLGRQAAMLIQQQLSKGKPCEQTLNPALLLAQRKRRDLITRLENGINLEEDEKSVFETIHTHSDAVAFPPTHSPPAKHPASHSRHDALSIDEKPASFHPQWEHYNTMRTRWRYLQPQVRGLVDDPQLVAPTTSTSHVRVGQTLLSGKYIDYQNFQSTVQARQSKTLNVAARSLMMSRKQEQERWDKLYVPKPFVRHPK